MVLVWAVLFVILVVRVVSRPARRGRLRNWVVCDVPLRVRCFLFEVMVSTFLVSVRQFPCLCEWLKQWLTVAPLFTRKCKNVSVSCRTRMIS